MATDEIRGALDRLKEWADTIQHYVYRTVVQGTWVGHEEFRADLALVESALRALAVPRVAPACAQEAACQHWPIYKTQAECAVCHPERAAEEPHAPWCPHVNDAATELCACKTEAK